MIKYDNCKTCAARCEHAGKDREFICPSGKSCKVTDNENAVYNYFNTVIVNGWTWQRLTPEEQERFKTCVDFSRIKGTARQRVEVLNMLYSAFLHGVGYTPIGWRESDPEAPKF